MGQVHKSEFYSLLLNINSKKSQYFVNKLFSFQLMFFNLPQRTTKKAILYELLVVINYGASGLLEF